MIDPLTFIALLPAVVLVVYICRKDRTDKEPPALLAKLLGFGALSCLPGHRGRAHPQCHHRPAERA